MWRSDAKYIDGSLEWFAAVKGFLSGVKCSHSGNKKVTMIALLAFAHDLFGINGHGTVSSWQGDDMSRFISKNRQALWSIMLTSKGAGYNLLSPPNDICDFIWIPNNTIIQ